jgi:hypothetical protein
MTPICCALSQLLAVLISQQLTLTPPVFTPAPPPIDPVKRLHLLEETLRVPFGEDWGGETHIGLQLGSGIWIGTFVRAWAEAPCDRKDCPDRAVHAGAEVKVQMTPAVDLGVNAGAHRSSTQRTGSMILPRVRIKF